MEAADASRALTQNPQPTPSATARETAQTSVVVSDEARPTALTFPDVDTRVEDDDGVTPRDARVFDAEASSTVATGSAESTIAGSFYVLIHFLRRGMGRRSPHTR
jgi:hypothetical protein